MSTYSAALLEELSKKVEVAHLTDAAGFRPEMNHVDLVHVQHEYFLFGGVAPWKNRFPGLLSRITVPAVMTVHEVVEPAGSSITRAAIRLTNRRQFTNEKVRRLIVHTQLDRDKLAGQGIDSRRIRVIRHGIPAPPILADAAESKQALGLTGRFVVTIFGFIARKKGHMAALDAVDRLEEDVLLLIAGGRHPDDRSDYVAAVTERARKSGVRARITGYLPETEVGAVMAASDLILAPFSETSGSGSLSLALACGKPILASDIPPHREIVDDTESALELTGVSTEALAESIWRLKNDEMRRAELSEGARRYAAGHEFARVAEETVAVYREVLDEVRS